MKLRRWIGRGSWGKYIKIPGKVYFIRDSKSS